MEPKILEEVQKQYREEGIDFNWELVRKNPKRYGVLYPLIGYFVSLMAIRFISLGVFMWLFLIGGFLLFLGGIYCANRIMNECENMKIQKEEENGSHC
jgi:hypothetical protein